MHNCPQCQTPLTDIGAGSQLFRVCVACGGREINLRLVQQNISALTFRRILNRLQDHRRYSHRRCPECKNIMRFISLDVAKHKIDLDICQSCQLAWFDFKEFEQLAIEQSGENALTVPPEIQQLLDLVVVENGKVVSNYMSFRFDRSDFGLGWDARGKESAGWRVLLGLLFMPLERENILRHRPWITWILLITTIAISVYAFFGDFGVIESFGLRPSQWDRLAGMGFISYFFVHGSWMHLIGNMYYLWAFGDNVEDQLGPFNFLFLVFLGSAGGAILHSIFEQNQQSLLIGASGGISALGMFYMLSFPRAKMAFFLLVRWLRVPAYIFLVVWIAMQVLMAKDQVEGYSQVSALCHLGGAMVGTFFYWLWKRGLIEREDYDDF